jgi:hypothetical protein
LDGNLYSPWTDGKVDEMECKSYPADEAHTGHAMILGDDPMALQVIPLGTHPGDASPYGGRYPCGSLALDGVWYYGTYCLMNEGGSLEGAVETATGVYNWGVLGAFVGFRISHDHGKSWIETPHTPQKPLFGEPQKLLGSVKIGAPHFVDFGKNMENSPDGKAYLVAHGASDPDPMPRPANLSWISGDQVYLIRVLPTVENINDPSKYEFFAGLDASSRPTWSRKISDLRPLIDWNNRCGCVTMTYNAPLKRYLMCVTDGWPTMEKMNTFILEADQITGPWRLVVYMKAFGEQGYFVNFPSKFIAEDGRVAWLCYAANFTNEMPDSRYEHLRTRFPANPPGSRYGMCLQEVRLPQSSGGA